MIPLHEIDEATVQALWEVWLGAVDAVFGESDETINAIGFSPSAGETEFYLELGDGAQARLRLVHGLDTNDKTVEFVATEIRYIINRERGVV